MSAFRGKRTGSFEWTINFLLFNQQRRKGSFTSKCNLGGVILNLSKLAVAALREPHLGKAEVVSSILTGSTIFQ
jgi:hypothetical protein